MAGKDHLDEVLVELGVGRWQAPMLLLGLAMNAMIPVQQIGSLLLSSPVGFRCSHPNTFPSAAGNASDGSGYQSDLPATISEFPSLCLDPANVSVSENPLNSSSVSFVSLTRYSTGLPSCPHVEYDTSVFSSTIVTEWHLICEGISWRTLFPMMFPIGSLIGSCIGGYFSDRIGRKRTTVIGVVLSVPSSLGILVVPWFSAMLAMKMLFAISTMFAFYAVYSLVAEAMPTRSRGAALNLMAVSFFVVMSSFGAIGYLVSDWRILWLICVSPVLIAVPTAFWSDESPRWLVYQGRGTEAAEVLLRAARQNGVQFSDASSAYIEKLKLMTTSEASAPKGENPCFSAAKTVASYLRSPAMRVILLVTPVLWLFQRMLYAGILLSANNFTNNSSFEFIIVSGVFGGVAILVTTPLVVRFGRKILIGGSLFTTSVLLLAELAVPEELWWLTWVLVMSASCLSVGAFQVNYVFAAELLPTVMRTMGFTLCNLVGCFGESFVPFVTEVVARYVSWGPSACFGFAGVMASLLVMLLPETKDSSLPESMADVEERHNKLKGRASTEKARDVEKA